MLVLLPLIQGFLFKKLDYIEDLVAVLETKRGEMVFTLLNEVIAIYVKLTFMNIWALRFKNSFWRIL